ncbi:N-acetyltransferase [Chryseobacterium sp. SNU WT5]|uniref:GNAT family N-acetyltransferase n=1 Tax=Chryseobacterium sp. SNU WT5 TaxID=2594269 RepID=UPI00117CB00E|nr:GNAT family N-acetyltransferase [Chryseobacterium sp. SNU WT5]QDP86109.1 N-acetyltransferase [Chryseobacterium sp. SNU WT5]
MTEVKKKDKSFELYYEGKKAGVIEYNTDKDGILDITHTEVDQEFGGKGLGKELVKAVVEYAKDNHYKIIASCPYAKKTMERTPEFKDVLVE